jgi:hypothetical protein
MGRPTAGQLTTMALAALEQVAAQCRHRPQRQTRPIAVVLAYLAHVSRAQDRWPFDQIWRDMKDDCRVTRSAQVSAALNAIYEALERRREIEAMSAFEREAAETHGPAQGFPS